jgi:proton glutamate symport protein
MFLGVAGKPGAGIPDDARALMGRSIFLSSPNTEVMLDSEGIQTMRPGIASFFSSMIPPNIFEALSLGSILAIVFFSVIMGFAIGFLHEGSALLLINLFTAIFYAFQKLISWALYLLPFALVCILAGHIAALGTGLFGAMSKLIVLFGTGALIIFIVCTFIIWLRSGIFNPIKLLMVLFEPVALALTTRNSLITLPSAINSLDNGMKFNSTEVKLTLPLGITLAHFGNVMYFALCVFFTAQFYGASLSFFHYIIIFAGVIAAGTATAGISGIATLAMLSIILSPLNLPLEAVLILFIAIDPIIDPIRNFLSVYVNMTATTIIANRDENAGRIISEEKHLLVFIQEIQNRPPLLNRVNGIPVGIEMSYIKEIGKRWNRHVVYKDGATMNVHEREWLKERADIIAGVISKEDIPITPAGYRFSKSWATVNIKGAKKELYFLLPEGKQNSREIDGIIQTLVDENYIKFIMAAAKLHE